MPLMRSVRILGGVGLLLLMAIGCAPPPTPTLLPPTPVLAASAQDIAGTWQGIGTDGLYMRFNADGTCYVATSLEARSQHFPSTQTCALVKRLRPDRRPATCQVFRSWVWGKGARCWQVPGILG